MERVPIRVEEKVSKQIKKAASREGVPAAEFCRRVFEWAFDQYSRVGELAGLRKMAITSQKQKATGKGKETK
jgi:hypothetical protein